jgi:hypothetical protein
MSDGEPIRLWTVISGLAGAASRASSLARARGASESDAVNGYQTLQDYSDERHGDRHDGFRGDDGGMMRMAACRRSSARRNNDCSTEEKYAEEFHWPPPILSC